MEALRLYGGLYDIFHSVLFVYSSIVGIRDNLFGLVDVSTEFGRTDQIRLFSLHLRGIVDKPTKIPLAHSGSGIFSTCVFHHLFHCFAGNFLLKKRTKGLFGRKIFSTNMCTW